MDEMKRTIEYALNGIPELKAEEKRVWLGEFRERVVMGVTYHDALRMEAVDYVQKALEDSAAEMLIVHNSLPIETQGAYMKLAKKMNKEYKSMATNGKDAMGVVVASRHAIDRRDVVPEIKLLPDKFRNISYHKLCNAHYEELKQEAPLFVQHFNQLNLGDKLIGLKCAVCEQETDGGPLL